jgi:hypothetical protein
MIVGAERMDPPALRRHDAAAPAIVTDVVGALDATSTPACDNLRI